MYVLHAPLPHNTHLSFLRVLPPQSLHESTYAEPDERILLIGLRKNNSPELHEACLEMLNPEPQAGKKHSKGYTESGLHGSRTNAMLSMIVPDDFDKLHAFVEKLETLGLLSEPEKEEVIAELSPHLHVHKIGPRKSSYVTAGAGI